MQHSKRSQEGYLLIDHTMSPGLPGLPAKFETATITCCHCNRIYVLNPERTRARGHCRKCDAYVCDAPACHLDCTPLKKTLDRLQEAAATGRNVSPGGIILP